MIKLWRNKTWVRWKIFFKKYETSHFSSSTKSCNFRYSLLHITWEILKRALNIISFQTVDKPLGNYEGNHKSSEEMSLGTFSLEGIQFWYWWCRPLFIHLCHGGRIPNWCRFCAAFNPPFLPPTCEQWSSHLKPTPNKTGEFCSCQLLKNNKMSNPKCFFDITADGNPVGKIVMEVNLFLSLFI